jgi:Kef-type K+ transport system membrane component KefB/nucleotide-binding universal stress UspA family protein
MHADSGLPPLTVLLLQMALILGVSRVLAELMKRIGQPTVIGELLTGIVLGPSMAGYLWPRYLQVVFPPASLKSIEVVAWLGMVMLLLLTGLETDVRLLRNLGRAAFTSSVFGMVVPFIAGFVLGMAIPSEHLANPERRLLFAAFLATAMSISAMPVIAKILLDLELTKRNIALIILSAGVVDDTTGWLLLSVISGIAQGQGMVLLQFGKTVLLTAVFLLGCRYLVYPVARWLFRTLDQRSRSPYADMGAIVLITFVLAAITEAIHIHAVFGAFIAGCILKQVPHLRASTVHRLEAVVLAILAPIFFGLAGLKVRLDSLSSPNLVMVVLAVATGGKLIGCTVGGIVGKMRFWESVAISVAMNARGAMELVVALIGLQLGILSPSMYAAIVVMAIATSFVAPIGLRLVLRLVKLTPEEEARMAGEGRKSTFDPTRLKIMIPTAGGPNALQAGRVAAALTRGESPTLGLVYVEPANRSIFLRLWRGVVPDQAGRNLQEHLDTIKKYADAQQVRVDVRRTTDNSPVDVICREAGHGYDLILVGAAGRQPLRSPLIGDLLERAPCHVAIVRAQGPVEDPKQILVAADGSFFSIAALELAILYAERVGAQVTVLYAMDAPDSDSDAEQADRTFDTGFRRMMATTLLTSMTPLIGKTKARLHVVVRESELPTPPLLNELRSGAYQLVVVGAENRQVQHRLGVGYDLDKILAEAPCPAMVVVPRISAAAEHH